MNLEIKQQNTDKEAESSILGASVLKQIKTQSLTPVPKWRFIVIEYGVWIAWAVSILFGAAAFSVMLFFMTHAPFVFYEASHDTFFGFLVDVFPQAWLFVFVGMGLFAHYNLRHTKYGYKYKLWQILVSSVLFSLLLGVVLHIVGMGIIVDRIIGNNVPFIEGFKHTQMRMWHVPQEGRLIGTFKEIGTVPHTAVLTDSAGIFWILNTRALNPFDLELLATGKEVHVIGVSSSTKDGYFYGCVVFPPIPEESVTFSQMRDSRDRFINRMKSYQGPSPQHVYMMGGEDSVIEPTDISVCESHRAVERVRHELMR